MTNEDFQIAIVGAGGIGSNLASSLGPAIHRGSLISSMGPVRMRIFDSDVVSDSNTSHQRFSKADVGGKKVERLKNSLSEFESGLLSIEACAWDVRDCADLDGSDLVVVGVDSSPARIVVHGMDVPWLDLRCVGDNYIALDSRMDPSKIEELTDENQKSGSCQMQGAIESGNIQFGHLAAAAHGAQWVIQNMRSIAGHEAAMPPKPKSSSITFGTLERMPHQRG